MTLEHAARSYKNNKQDYKALQGIIDQELMPGLLELFYQNNYQPNVELCNSLGQLIASHVARALQWQEGSIERLSSMTREDVKQELYVLMYKVIDSWDGLVDFTPFFGEVLIECLLEWYCQQ